MGLSTQTATVLSKRAYGESDLILTLLCREQGVVSALARGARASKKRFAGALSAFVISTVEIRAKPGRDLSTLSSAFLERSYAGLASDLIAYGHGCHGIEIAQGLLAPEQPATGAFVLLERLFARLANIGPSPFVLRSFELQLLEELGLAPSFENCAACQNEFAKDEDTRYVHRRGALICERCAGAEMGGIELPSQARRILRAAAHCDDFSSVDKELDGSPAIRAAARNVSLNLIQSHLGKPLKSIEFMRKISLAS